MFQRVRINTLEIKERKFQQRNKGYKEPSGNCRSEKYSN